MKSLPSGRGFELFIFCAILLCGCNKADISDSAEIHKTSQKTTNVITGQIKAAADLVQSGAIDDAAARLVQLRVSAPYFSPQEAAQYRQTMSEAYSRALEAAQKGDPRAQTAMRLLRAAGPK